MSASSEDPHRLPEETPMACTGPGNGAAMVRSNSSTSRPRMNWPESSTR